MYMIFKKYHHDVHQFDDSVRCASACCDFVRKQTESGEWERNTVHGINAYRIIHSNNYWPLGKCCEFILGTCIDCYSANASTIFRTALVCLNSTFVIRTHYSEEKIFRARRFLPLLCKPPSVCRCSRAVTAVTECDSLVAASPRHRRARKKTHTHTHTAPIPIPNTGSASVSVLYLTWTFMK